MIQNCRGRCLHLPELRGDVGIAPYKKMNFYIQYTFNATAPYFLSLNQSFFEHKLRNLMRNT